MKRLKLLALLAGGNVVVGVSIAVLCLFQVVQSREAAHQNTVLTGVGQNRQALELLALQSLEYAKKNPALMADLNRLGLTAPADNKGAR
jgi:hypothetical protein